MAARRLAILGSCGIPARYGGFETFAEEIAVRLVRKGIQVTVFCEGNQDGKPVTYKSVALVYVPAPRLGPLTTIVFDLRCLWRARKSYDVVYMLGYGASIFCFLPRLWGRKVWINMDGVEWFRTKWNWLAKTWFVFSEAMAMWTANIIIADAVAIQAHLVKRHRRVPKCFVIPYGAEVVDSEPESTALADYGVNSGQYYLVVCRLEPENHVLEIIDGFAESNSPHPLIVVGDRNSGTPYVERLLQVDEDRIRFVGTLFDGEKLRSLRWHCRGYFHGHSVGGTNPSLLEALGCGNNIIAHDNAFNREVADSFARYFSSACDIPELVAELDNAELTDRQRSSSMQRLLSKYTWDGVTDKYLQLITTDL